MIYLMMQQILQVILDPNNPEVIIEGSNSDELDRRLSVINDATIHAKQTSKIIKLYRQNIQNAYSELGEAFSSDPVLLRAYAKERTKADLIKIRVEELQSKKKEIQKQLDEFKEKLDYFKAEITSGKLEIKELEFTFFIYLLYFDHSAS